MTTEKTVLRLAVFVGTIAALSGFCFADEPNSVRMTTYFSADSFVASTAYSDGLGKTIQNQLHIPHSEEAVVSGTYFDGLGRDSIMVKPFIFTTNHEFLSDQTSSNLIKKANTYYGPTNITLPQANGFAYSETQYYDDPLGRVKATGSIGLDLALSGSHHPQTWYYGLDNTGSHFVPTDTLWPTGAETAEYLLDHKVNDITEASDANKTPLYFLTVNRDANGNYTQELKDVFGKTIKTWANHSGAKVDTIVAEYQYDIVGNLIAEIPPKDQNELDPTTYKYNPLGQLETKKSPDAGEVQYKYDAAGRLRFVLTQKASEAGENNFLVYTYDALGRNIKISQNEDKTTGLFDNPDVATLSSEKIKVENFYDTVLVGQLPKGTGIDAALLSSLTNGRGQLVATVAWDDFSDTKIKTVQQALHVVIDLYSFDEQGSISIKYKYLPGQTMQKFSFTYDLQGNVLSIMRNDDLTTKKMFCYNARGQLIETGKGVQKLSAYLYNDIGKLSEKQFFGSANTTPFEAVHYAYTIQDWMSSIATTSTGQTLFSEDIFYNAGFPTTATIPTDAAKNYNGNITYASYTINKASDWKLYYQYDRINRLINTLNNNKTVDPYSEAFKYDKIGRIVKKQEGTSVGIDENTQTYEYEKYTNSDGVLRYRNRLAYVNQKHAGATREEPNYLYDPDGNMVLDRSKKMVVTYDWRNLPVAFTFYQSIPSLSDGSVTWKNINQLEIIKNVRVLSQVVMMYDASGSRVLKTTTVPVGSN